MSAGASDDLSELLGFRPEQDEDDAPELAEAKAEPVADEPEADESDDEPDVRDEGAGRSEPESAAAEAKADEDEDDEPEESPEKRRADGLQKEVARLRRELRETQARQQAQQAPAPAPPIQPQASQAPPQPAKPKGIPVVVSEDGQHVYVDPDALDQTVEQRAKALIAEAQRPTPEQIVARQQYEAAQAFAAEMPEQGRAVLETAERADDFLSLSIQSAMARGYQPRSMGDVMQIVRDEGIAERVAEHFPEVAPVLDEFIEAYATNNAAWKRSIWRRMAQESGRDVPVDDRPAPALKSVSGAPQSLSRKGGSRSKSPAGEEAEFDALEREYRSSAIFDFPQKKYERMKELGGRLSKPGWV